MNIIIAHGSTSIEACHSLIPFVLLKNENAMSLSFVNYNRSNLSLFCGDLLIIVRKYHKVLTSVPTIICEIESYRENFGKIVYFDDSASSSEIQYHLIPYLDEYWVRSLLTDRSKYSLDFYGNGIFSDYYHEKFNICDMSPKKCYGFDYFEFSDKIKIAWNLGIGLFPAEYSILTAKYYPWLRKFITLTLRLNQSLYEFTIRKLWFLQLDFIANQRFADSQKFRLVSARIDFKGYDDSVGYQRRLFLSLLHKLNIKQTMRLSFREYIVELKSSKSVFSPFGWGEICYRDFEAIYWGSTLVKPNVSHLATWPDIYSDGYVSVDWDGERLGQSLAVVDDYEGCSSIRERAWGAYVEGLANCHTRAQTLICDVLNK